MPIEPTKLHELVVRAPFDDLTLIEDQNGADIAKGREPMRDEERRAPLDQSLERVENDGLRPRVDRGRRLVEDEDRCVIQERPSA